ncbi:MAG: hypothetical protein K9N46_08095 [Candidatus Marinimicrobia bacterium]|nr:hypothetical protein [Candidatus Neomarinimicrobiota bacterium]MCF7828767.1 hypothetical protein [Candidatus Neomarinimicrobiota bacterium]MCF7880684.1 hypothetical protein [Candidatus Neomarinimicrobiota bacterium]
MAVLFILTVSRFASGQNQNSVTPFPQTAGSGCPPLIETVPKINSEALNYNTRLSIFIGLGVCLVELLLRWRQQNKLSDRAKRGSFCFGSQCSVEVLETNGTAGFFSHFFSKKKCIEKGVSGSDRRGNVEVLETNRATGFLVLFLKKYGEKQFFIFGSGKRCKRTEVPLTYFFAFSNQFSQRGLYKVFKNNHKK